MRTSGWRSGRRGDRGLGERRIVLLCGVFPGILGVFLGCVFVVPGVAEFLKGCIFGSFGAGHRRFGEHALRFRRIGRIVAAVGRRGTIV